MQVPRIRDNKECKIILPALIGTIFVSSEVQIRDYGTSADFVMLLTFFPKNEEESGEALSLFGRVSVNIPDICR